MNEEIAELRKAIEKVHDQLSDLREGIILAGAKADRSWAGFAFTINYILLGLILWRVW